MNERIRELAEQAWDATAVSPEFGHPVSFAEKFSELIVRECARVVENLCSGYKDYRNQIEDAFRRDCVEEMKQHFGVE
jgi:hypothetical protein